MVVKHQSFSHPQHQASVDKIIDGTVLPHVRNRDIWCSDIFLICITRGGLRGFGKCDPSYVPRCTYMGQSVVMVAFTALLSASLLLRGIDVESRLNAEEVISLCPFYSQSYETLSNFLSSIRRACAAR